MIIPAVITPNSLTIARLLLIPFGAIALFINGGDDYNWQIVSWWIFFILGLSDIFDGKLARSRQQVTELGKFLDPVADKAMVGTAMVCLSIIGRLPWWITIVIMAREIAITLFRISIVKRGVIPANKGGKIKAALQGFGTGFYVLPLDPNLYWFRDGFMYITILVTLWTGAYYVRSAFKK
ncbi:MAG: CDP-diacylglycerol--glycerol-3-phosphate 3-phosphatidyltransferase [Candidatus Planktophila sp.]